MINSEEQASKIQSRRVKVGKRGYVKVVRRFALRDASRYKEILGKLEVKR